MRRTRTIQTVDVHCAGEIGRVITGGVLNVPGATMADKLHHLNAEDDGLRRWLCSEPRSGPAGSFCLLVPACDPAADVGLIILQPDRAHAMSGSNAMCAATALLETGMIPMVEPESVVTFDTAAGLVRATATCEGGKVVRVALDMPPALVMRRGVVIETPDWGPVRYDLCFGGVFHALVDVDRIGLAIAPRNVRALATAGVDLRARIAAVGTAPHPTTPALSGLAYVMFRAEEPDGALRTCTTLRPGRADRSPCGTGSNASMAVRAGEGRVDVPCNNAGINRRGPLLDLTSEDGRLSCAVNLDAMLHLCQSVLPGMIAQGGGAIVNTASQWGLYPAPNHIACNVTRAAVASFTQNLARDYAPHRFRVNAVCPGEIHTPMLEAGVSRSGRTIADLDRLVPFGRIGRPEEVAAPVGFLASDEAVFMCGALVEITGAQAVA